jgi:hypothetical protein
MKKTNAKKLVLNAEKIKSLGRDALQAVMGGVSGKDCQPVPDTLPSLHSCVG